MQVINKIKYHSSKSINFLWCYFPFFFLIILAQALRRSHGALRFNHLCFITAALIIFAFFHVKNESKLHLPNIFLKVIQFTFIIFLITKNEIIYAQDNIYTQLIKYTLYLLSGLTVLSFFNLKLKLKSLINKSSFLFIGIILFLIPLSSPSPIIDVYTILTEAAQNLLNGINPYAATYPDIYNGQYNYEPNLIYWPVGLILNTISHFLLNDIRYVLSFSLLVSSLIIRKKNENLSLILLLFPVSIFIIEQAWVEALLIPLYFLLTKTIEKKRIFYAAACLGILCATKQFLIFTAIHSLIYILKKNNSKVATKYFLVSAAIGSSIMAPFLIWNSKDFIKNTIFNILNYPARMDTLSWMAYFQKMHDITITSTFVNVTYLSVLIAGSIYLYVKKSLEIKDFLFIEIFTYAIVFLIGKQAFCNYYFFLAMLLILYIKYSYKKSTH